MHELKTVLCYAEKIFCIKKDIITFLRDLNVTACSHANNHITDFDSSIKEQKKTLLSNNIEFEGG